ncbi:hypothetical protein GS429_10970 [Natronorubrum sp. JWXQ-INN-674]|uniref:HD domain-containing protein n=1 Tax=Natronorubrum halalkaliphilum TaxID=2691917 RepID=A0A6B0VN12_9EURY|nr:hypothetical protein [Natronorubrum halalkaliphilum]MXV62575.1 hypothetical protein [Natronorubrum halalkaliphilum]
MERFDDENTSRSRRIDHLEDEVATLARDLRAADESGDEFRAQFEAVVGELQALLAERNGGYGTINTRSGGTITPLSADPADVSIDDIAHALANLTRFTGQGTEPYSVARHSVHVSHEVEARGGSPAAIRWGLLHDATEAYLANVPAPVKETLPGYTHAEASLAATVRDAFDLDLSSADERLVDAADSDVGRYELAVHFPDAGHEKPALEYDPGVLGGDAADELFLRRARALGVE